MNSKRKLLVIMLLALLALIVTMLPTVGAFAAYTININVPLPPGNAYGNSSTPDGQTLDLTPPINGNTLNINAGGQVGVTSLYGGYWHLPAPALPVPVTNNTVNIYAGAAVTGGGATGGYSDRGNVTGNTVNIYAGATVAGGLATGGYSDRGNVTGNNVNVSDGRMISLTGGSSSTGDATGNSVTITGGTTEVVYGGVVRSNVVGDATGNNVTVTGGTVIHEIHGGYGSDNATGNSVTITGGTIGSGTYGGVIFGGISYRGDATGNSVTITGGTVFSRIYGGICDYGNATGNTITLSGTPDLRYASIHGGAADISPTQDEITGNTLNLHTAGLTTRVLRNFEFINFHLSSIITSPMITITDSVSIGGTTVALHFTGAPPALRPGDQIILVDAMGGTITGRPVNATATAGGYTFDIAVVGSQLIASLRGTTPPPSSLPRTSDGFPLVGLLGLLTATLASMGLLAFRGNRAARRQKN